MCRHGMPHAALQPAPLALPYSTIVSIACSICCLLAIWLLFGLVVCVFCSAGALGLERQLAACSLADSSVRQGMQDVEAGGRIKSCGGVGVEWGVCTSACLASPFG